MAEQFKFNLSRAFYLNLLTNRSELWAMAACGDKDAYALLHKDLYPLLHHYLLKMVKDEELTDDLLQDLFIKIWTRRLQIGSIKNVKAYFFIAARSMAINYFNQQKVIGKKLDHFLHPIMEFSCEDIIIATETDTELKQAIANALNNLPARQREILYLKFYEDMDYAKIAEITGIRYQSVINHVFRAIQTLRSVFGQQKNDFLQLA